MNSSIITRARGEYNDQCIKSCAFRKWCKWAGDKDRYVKRFTALDKREMPSCETCPYYAHYHAPKDYKARQKKALTEATKA